MIASPHREHSRAAHRTKRSEKICDAYRVVQKQNRTPFGPNGATYDTAPVPVSLRLPRTLRRPTLGETDTAIATAYPEMAGIPSQYVRDTLRADGQTMFDAAAKLKLPLPSCRTALPAHLSLALQRPDDSTTPTIVFAVSQSSPVHTKQKRTVQLFPAHDIIFTAHCANLPSLPASRLSTETKVLPVVPLCLPSAGTFPLLAQYLYTKDCSALFTALAPSGQASDVRMLARHASMIYGLWSNACAMGVLDSSLFDTVDQAWNVVLDCIEQTRQT